jgi:hypothetical protein
MHLAARWLRILMMETSIDVEALVQMSSNPWQWYESEMVRFILFGLPILALLWNWSRRGSKKGVLYRACLLNLLSFSTYFACVSILPFAVRYRKLTWVAYSGIPSLIIVGWPLLFAAGSLVICMLAFLAKGIDRLFTILCGILMLILWASSLVPPN